MPRITLNTLNSNHVPFQIVLYKFTDNIRNKI